jgi:hypothetical protein
MTNLIYNFVYKIYTKLIIVFLVCLSFAPLLTVPVKAQTYGYGTSLFSQCDLKNLTSDGTEADMRKRNSDYITNCLTSVIRFIIVIGLVIALFKIAFTGIMEYATLPELYKFDKNAINMRKQLQDVVVGLFVLAVLWNIIPIFNTALNRVNFLNPPQYNQSTIKKANELTNTIAKLTRKEVILQDAIEKYNEVCKGEATNDPGCVEARNKIETVNKQSYDTFKSYFGMLKNGDYYNITRQQAQDMYYAEANLWRSCFEDLVVKTASCIDFERDINRTGTANLGPYMVAFANYRDFVTSRVNFGFIPGGIVTVNSQPGDCVDQITSNNCIKELYDQYNIKKFQAVSIGLPDKTNEYAIRALVEKLKVVGSAGGVSTFYNPDLNDINAKSILGI